MAKNQFFDVIPPSGKRSIRDIPLPSKPRGFRDEPIHSNRENDMRTDRIPSQRPMPPPVQEELKGYNEIPDGHFEKLGQRRKRGWMPIFVGIVLLGFIAWGASYGFHSAVVEIIPKQVRQDVSISFKAKVAPAPNEVGYDTVTYSTAVSKTLEATGEKDVTRKASGKVIVYNDFSEAPQELVMNTRFESKEGKIYRIDKDITIPGQKTVDGKKLPGSIEVTVFADAPGEAFNNKETDFTIPGFKGTPKYQGFYGRSATPITGGFIGKEKSVDEALLSQSKETITGELEQKLLKDILARIPETFILIPGAYSITHEDMPVRADGNQALIEIKGTIVAKVFKKDDMDRIIVQSVPNMPFLRGTVKNYEALVVTIDPTLIMNEEFDVDLTGNAIINGKVDADKLKTDLAGKPKKEVRNVIATYPEIDSAEATIKPMWMFTMPSSVDKIRLVTKE